MRLSKEEAARFDVVCHHYGLVRAELVRMLIKREYSGLVASGHSIRFLVPPLSPPRRPPLPGLQRVPRSKP